MNPVLLQPDIDEQIRDLLKSETYIDAECTQRRELVQTLLERLQREGLITNYLFQPQDQMFSYLCPDGSLGGIELQRGYPQPEGREPLNQL